MYIFYIMSSNLVIKLNKLNKINLDELLSHNLVSALQPIYTSEVWSAAQRFKTEEEHMMNPGLHYLVCFLKFSIQNST